MKTVLAGASALYIGATAYHNTRAPGPFREKAVLTDQNRQTIRVEAYTIFIPDQVINETRGTGLDDQKKQDPPAKNKTLDIETIMKHGEKRVLEFNPASKNEKRTWREEIYL